MGPEIKLRKLVKVRDCTISYPCVLFSLPDYEAQRRLKPDCFFSDYFFREGFPENMAIAPVGAVLFSKELPEGYFSFPNGRNIPARWPEFTASVRINAASLGLKELSEADQVRIILGCELGPEEDYKPKCMEGIDAEV